jgi:hypothetical protein
MSKLREKGLISGGVFHRKRKGGVPTLENPSTGTQRQHLIRLHGQEFSLKVLNASPKFRDLSKLGVIDFEGHKVQLFPSLVIVHSFSGLEFVAESSQAAYTRSVPYWLALFERLEKALNVLIFKEGTTQIKQLKAHYAEENNELAQDLKAGSQRLRLIGKDSQTWLITDLSKGTPELETIHPQLSLNDMAAIKPFFDDLRQFCPGMTFSAFKEGFKEALGLSQPLYPGPQAEASPMAKPDYIG